MALPVQTFTLSAPGKGGVNEKFAPHLINDDQSAPPNASTLALKNVNTDETGDVMSRKGYTVYANLSTYLDDVAGFTQYRQFDNDEFEIAAGVKSGTPKIVNFSSPGALVDITNGMTFTEDKRFDFCTVADTLILTTEASDAPMKYTGGAGVSLLGGSPPSGKYCEEFFNYAILANTLANPERVYWSNVFAPETWTATDFKRLEAPCTGLIKKDSNLIIFTRNSITVAQYTGDSLLPFTFDRLETNIGCISNASIQNIEGVIYWLASDGHIYRMSGLQPERVTEAIPKTIATLIQGSLTKAVGINHKELRQYWCAVTKDDTNNDFVIVVDYLNNEIFFYDGMQINSAANISDSSGATRTFFGDRTGRIYLTNEGYVDYPAGSATDITWWRYSKQFSMNSSSNPKRFSRIGATINARGNYISTIQGFVDYGATTTDAVEFNHSGDGEWGTGIYGLGFGSGNDQPYGAKDSNLVFTDISGTGKYIQFKWSGVGQDEPVVYKEIFCKHQTYPRAC